LLGRCVGHGELFLNDLFADLQVGSRPRQLATLLAPPDLSLLSLDTTQSNGISLTLMSASYVLFLAFAIGVVAGLRAMTAPAVVAWAANRNWLPLHNTSLSFMGSTAAVVIFTLLAVLELITDQLPSTPARTKPVGLTARVITGGFSGAAVAISGGQGFASGAVLGALGGIVGAFAGYQVRTRSVKALNVPDFVVAVVEDAVAIGAGLFIVTRF
jgi:uncharacterized membrane protein